MTFVFIFLAGLIDSIIGGGGLISLPTVSLELGVGPQSIGTNKVIALAAALTSLLVFMRLGHFEWRKSSRFAVFALVGAWIGASVARFIPSLAMHIILLIILPTCACALHYKDRIIDFLDRHRVSLPLGVGGFLCGFYDGSFGPGAGLFMFLYIHAVRNEPILESLASAKLANTLTALSSLINFQINGYVNWNWILPYIPVMIVASVLGAFWSSRNLARYLKPLFLSLIFVLFIKILDRTLHHA